MQKFLGSNVLKPDVLREEYVSNQHNWSKTKTKSIQTICWKDIHIQPILFKSVDPLVFFLKTYRIEDLNSSVQSLITMDKDRSFGNIFRSYNFRVSDTMKFLTIRKSWGHILQLYAKGKSSLISQQVQFFHKKSKKTYNFMVPLNGWDLTHSF